MNILLTSVGRRTYMIKYFKEVIGKRGHVHAANSTYTYSMQVADKSVITPLIYDSNYIDFLLEYCLANEINVIIPLFDIDLPVLAKNKTRFEQASIQVVVSNNEFVETCNDKWQTYRFLSENNFKTPKSFLRVSDALQAINAREVQFPLILKPRWGMGSIGIFEAENEKELEVLYNKVKNTIHTSYLRYESIKSPENNVIIQEKLQGEEYGIDIFNDLNGEYLTSIPKRKLGMRAGETDSAEIIENSDLSSIGKKISSFSKHIGNLDVDCFFMNNEFYILEMNCRFGGQYPFSHLAGANFPGAIIRMVRGEILIKKDKSLRFNIGVIGIKDIVPKTFKQ